VIVLLLLGAVAAAAYWAGTQSRRYPREDRSRQPATRRGAERELGGDVPPPRRMTAPTWPWVLGLVLIGRVDPRPRQWAWRRVRRARRAVCTGAVSPPGEAVRRGFASSATARRHPVVVVTTTTPNPTRLRHRCWCIWLCGSFRRGERRR
jgi:hypothetical protein